MTVFVAVSLYEMNLNEKMLSRGQRMVQKVLQSEIQCEAGPSGGIIIYYTQYWVYNQLPL